MRYIVAKSDHTEAIHYVLQTTIRSVYPKYYPAEVVEFFCSLHCIEHVREGVASGHMGVLLGGNGEVVGTGCYDGNHITGVYVLPAWQGRGCGTQIIEQLEKLIEANHDTVCLEASLPAVCLYEHRGYRTVGHGVIDLEGGVKLVYEKMERQLK
ncbi:GNAT family N-acetyltransferase [Adlercreutzia sp. ZJ138]|uniref:GNAT family N-acetyltransferase n=1 Tax=Adlercreutzia sp. ZJ138 TaxID=2709405 RepID=UPI0013EAC02B|nr:GNAT family N-acetyltransferase [Adlercreutzia sp. ZJ138]